MLTCFTKISEGVSGASLKKLEARLLDRIKSLEQKLDTNGSRLQAFEAEYAATRELDLYAFADQSERADYGSNLLKANCVLITGIDYLVSGSYTKLARYIKLSYT